MAKCSIRNNCGSNKLFYTKPFEDSTPIIPPVCGVTYADPFLVFTPDGDTVIVDMTFLTEVLVVEHKLMRRGENDPSYSQIGDPIPYNEVASGQYSIVDPSPPAGFTLYKIITTLTGCPDVESTPQLYVL